MLLPAEKNREYYRVPVYVAYADERLAFPGLGVCYMAQRARARQRDGVLRKKERKVMSKIKMTTSLLILCSIFLPTQGKSFDSDSIAYVSRSITEWKTMHADKSTTQIETPVSPVYVSSSLSGFVERGNKGIEIKDWLAFDSKRQDYIAILNEPRETWYPVDSLGIPGGLGAKPLPGERIRAHIDDPVSWLPTWRNLMSIPASRSSSSISPMLDSGSGVGLRLAYVEFGAGSPRKVLGTGGHFLKSYESAVGPIQSDRIRAHSGGGLPLYNEYASGGWKAIEPLQGKTILGYGHSPIEVGKNQIASGGYASNFWVDVLTRGPQNFGLPVGHDAFRRQASYQNTLPRQPICTTTYRQISVGGGIGGNSMSIPDMQCR